MIPEIQTFIENKSSSPESFDSLNKLILEVNNRNVSILMIVEDLSDTLVSTDPKVRAKGIELLIRVFCSCNIDTITPKMEVPKAMIEELTIQGYQQTVRHVIFKCYETLVDKYLDVLKTIEDTFVPGFVQTVEGEKDPRNIMIIFKIIKIIVSELNYKPYVELLLFANINDCLNYLYILFICRECLVSVPELSKFAIPQLIEKLSSRLDNTKRDALDVLIAGGDVYNFEDYSSNLDKLTEILRDEAFDNAGEVLEEDYIKAITGFTKIFSRGGNEWIDKYVDQMTTKPISYIKDFGHPRGKFSRNIICAVIKENEYAFNKLINQVFPDLMTKIVQPNPPSVQSFLMEYVKNLLSIANLQNISEDHLIYQYKDTLYREFNKLKECDDDNDFKKSMEITSIGGLYELANLKGFLSDEQDMIDSNYEWILQSTEDITVECKFYEDTMNKLIDIYDKGIEEKKNKDYLTKLLESIKNIIERGIKIEDDKSLIISCFPLFKNNILRILIKNSINQREELPNVELISSIFQKYISILAKNQIKKFNEEILSIFIDNKTLDLMEVDNTIKFEPFNENSPKSQTCLLNILISVTCEVDDTIFKNTTVKKVNEKYLNKLVDRIINTLNSYYANLASKFISLYCIRFNNEKKIQKKIKNWIEKDIYSIINSNMVFKECAIILFSWLSKVLYIKSNNDATNYAMKLISLIHNQNHDSSCVNGIKTIFDKTSYPTETEKLYTVDKTFEEKLINTLLKELITTYKNSEQGKNLSIIIALGVLLKLSDIKKIANKDEIKPIMLYALTLPNAEVLSSSIEILSVIVKIEPNELKNDLTTLVEFLLKLTKARNSPSNTIKVRVLSLRLLDLISTMYESYLLLPIKQTVLNELDSALDDNKKYVRKMAVHCRNQWFTLN
ncbi:hypothetical protein LY90DRAFT_502110 [Neocallimastix californiae]|uniref:MMS19 nucleotide excision repair protein n=1 Tax=Neocallimastix californiae TaxID=1754190 RepID=A0A1Y2EVE4_9FUNG|nr:hypothetical protein LY90DRAFT_502110 [Neocallimastix californiae]|eukprot:ORY75562.1 hypothetical protein LY90DRAFT_502110 [Neocallimastix californiae]